MPETITIDINADSLNRYDPKRYQVSANIAAIAAIALLPLVSNPCHDTDDALSSNSTPIAMECRTANQAIVQPSRELVQRYQNMGKESWFKAIYSNVSIGEMPRILD